MDLFLALVEGTSPSLSVGHVAYLCICVFLFLPESDRLHSKKVQCLSGGVGPRGYPSGC